MNNLTFNINLSSIINIKRDFIRHLYILKLNIGDIMNSLKLFGKRLKELRKLNKLTQEQLAELIGLDPKQICRIENGACFTTFETLQKIADTLNIEIFELFHNEHKKTRDALIKEMEQIFKNTSDENIELIYKLVKAIIY